MPWATGPCTSWRGAPSLSLQGALQAPRCGDCWNAAACHGQRGPAAGLELLGRLSVQLKAVASIPWQGMYHCSASVPRPQAATGTPVTATVLPRASWPDGTNAPSRRLKERIVGGMAYTIGSADKKVAVLACLWRPTCHSAIGGRIPLLPHHRPRHRQHQSGGLHFRRPPPSHHWLQRAPEQAQRSDVFRQHNHQRLHRHRRSR